jgi:hypothetical protein
MDEALDGILAGRLYQTRFALSFARHPRVVILALRDAAESQNRKSP